MDENADHMARANVHLVPNPNVPTGETGTRNRTAERVARSMGVPCLSVSEDMAVVTVYTKNERYQLEPIPAILSRCNQALQTLERYRNRLDEESSSLTALEIEDAVTLRDVVTLLQRAELVARISEEIEQYLVELGSDGRLVRLQLRELMAGVADERRLVVLDYFQEDISWDLEQAIETLSSLDGDYPLDPADARQALPLSRTSPPSPRRKYPCVHPPHRLDRCSQQRRPCPCASGRCSWYGATVSMRGVCARG